MEKRKRNDDDCSADGPPGGDNNDVDYTVLLCYLYAEVASPHALAAWIEDVASSLCLTGRVLVAKEGIKCRSCIEGSQRHRRTQGEI